MLCDNWWTVPIIIVSSRDSDAEKIMGIELGADDYLVKPFNLELLLTKIRASIRRAYGEYASSVTNHNLGDLPIFYMEYKILSFQPKRRYHLDA